MLVIIFSFLFIFSAEAIEPIDVSKTVHPGKLNCLNKKNQRKYKTLCSNVIDPMKFKRGEMEKLNCLGPLGDGYEMGICEQVSISEQLRMKNKKKQR